MATTMEDLRYDPYYEAVRVMHEDSALRWLPAVDEDAFVLEAIESPTLVIQLV